MAIQESGEMYLESIYILSKERDLVRAIDVSEFMGFSKPSVSRAVKLLKDKGFIEIAENGNITLTKSGLDVANKMYSRHTTLTEILKSLGVSEKTAEADACRMEHVISDETFNALQNHIKK